MSIDPNLGPIGPTGPTGPTPQEGQGPGLINPLYIDEISPSEQEALMMIYLMQMPSLQQPEPQEGGFSPNVSAIGSMIAAGFAEIGAKVWDKYLDYLEEQKQRIQEYLESPRYRVWLEEHTPAYFAKVEDTKPEQFSKHALNLWTHYIDGVSSYVSRNQETNPEGTLFLAASFVISSAFIGDYMNIVDVASTNMVGVNPIQDAAGSILPVLPQDLQESVVLTINLFALGVVYYTTAELVAKEKGEPPKNQDFAKAFGKNVIGKVSGNEVNYFLMAMLVNTLEQGKPVTEQRINELASMAKAVMLAVALAVLYKVETGWIKGQEFVDMLEGKMNPRTSEEAELVKMVGTLRQSLGENWENIADALGRYFESNPDIEDILNPMKVYAGVTKNLAPPPPAA